MCDRLFLQLEIDSVIQNVKYVCYVNFCKTASPQGSSNLMFPAWQEQVRTKSCHNAHIALEN